MDLASEESERLPCLLTLLDLGANVNARDKQGTYMLLSLTLKYRLNHLFILKHDCCGLVFKGKTSLLHAMESSDGLTVHNTENMQLLLETGTDCETQYVAFTYGPSNSVTVKPLHSDACVRILTCAPLCIFTSK